MLDNEEHLYVTDDHIVTHNTVILLFLLCLMHSRKELTDRAVLIVQTPSTMQYAREAARWAPGLRTLYVTGDMTPSERATLYAENWDVLIIGYHVALRDQKMLEAMGPFSIVISDDVDPLINHDTATHKMIVRLSALADRAITTNATALQMHLAQLHAATYPAGGAEVFGELSEFKERYYRYEPVLVTVGRERRVVNKHVGYKNMDELREKLRPIYLRRRYTEFTDARMPMLAPPSTVWLEMSPQQRARYEELQRGVVRLLTESGGEKIKHVSAMTAFGYGQRICAGLPALKEPDGPGASPKLDWLMEKLTTSWEDRKVIAFVKNTGMVSAAIARCARLGIGVAQVRGADPETGYRQTAAQRDVEVQRFRRDPDCRLMVGTSAIERSLNLQVANTMVNVDIPLNPARVQQILGRMRRAGSAFEHVFLWHLFMIGTQEEDYLDVLRQRQGLIDYVNNEDAELFEALTAEQLLHMIGDH